MLNSLIKKVEKRAREEKLAHHKIPEYIRFAGLSVVDPMGNSIIPVPVVLEETSLTGPGGSTKSGNMGEGEDEEEKEEKDPALMTIFDQHPHEILLKVWNVEAGGMQGDFLGYALIPTDFITHPAKGARSFPLQSDPKFVRVGKEKLQINGSIFIKLTPTKTVDARVNKPAESAIDPHKLIDLKRQLTRSGKSFKEINPMIDEKEYNAVEDFVLPCSWRLQIFRCTKIVAVDRIERSSPMVEVCWKGAVTKRSEKLYETKSFIQIGKTSTKQNTLDPNWKDDPSATFELPPVWTDWNIPGRGDGGLDLTGGGWVSKNNIPDMDVGDDKARQFKGSYLTSAQKDDSLKSSASRWLDVDGLAQEEHDNFNPDDPPIVAQRSRGLPAPKPKVAPKEMLKSAMVKVKTATILGSHTIENLEVALDTNHDHSAELCLQEKVQLRLDAWMALTRAEETERKCMAR